MGYTMYSSFSQDNTFAFASIPSQATFRSQVRTVPSCDVNLLDSSRFRIHARREGAEQPHQMLRVVGVKIFALLRCLGEHSEVCQTTSAKDSSTKLM